MLVAVVRGDAVPPWMAGLERLEVIHGDLRDASTWSRVPASITHVFHLAAAIERDPGRAQRAALVHDNLTPVAHLLEQCRSWPRLRQVVYSSSVSVFGSTTDILDESCQASPRNLYAAAKLAGEALLQPLRARGIAVASLRYTSLYGAGMYAGTVLPVMIRAAREEGEIVVHGRGLRAQDFLHAHDAAVANALACRYAADGVYIIGSGVSVSMAELAEAISRVFTAGQARVRFVSDTPDGPPGYRIDLTRAAGDLHYHPQYDLDAGLRQMRKSLGVRPRCAPSLCS